MGVGGLLDGIDAGSLATGEPVYHYSLISSFAEACVVPERSCVVIPKDVPFDVAGLVGCAITTGIGAVWNTAKVRPGDRVAIVGCGGVGLSALLGAVAAGAGEIVAVDVSEAKLAVAAAARCDAGRPLGGLARGDGAKRCAQPPQAASTMPSRPPADPRRCSRRSCRPATAAPRCSSGSRARTPSSSLPPLSIPRMERRILGSIYGSSRPERDFLTILDLYRRGRLPLDRLVSHRLPLDRIDEAFALMHAGEARRAVLDLDGEAT